MHTMSDGGGATPSAATSPLSTVPLMVQPEALAATAERLDSIAADLEQCLRNTSAKLVPTPPGSDEVSTTSTSWLAAQQASADQAITAGITELRRAADNCRTSAMQYTQTDESFGSTARRP